jgi:hypothetical protein
MNDEQKKFIEKLIDDLSYVDPGARSLFMGHVRQAIYRAFIFGCESQTVPTGPGTNAEAYEQHKYLLSKVSPDTLESLLRAMLREIQIRAAKIERNACAQQLREIAKECAEEGSTKDSQFVISLSEGIENRE